MFVHDGLDVLALAGELAFVVRVSVDPAVGKDDVLANLGYLGVYLHFLAHLDDVQKLGRNRNRNGSHVGHPQHSDRRDHIDHRRQRTPMHCLLDIPLVSQKAVLERG